MKTPAVSRFTLALTAGAVALQAAAADLKVGDPAPKLQVAKWAQGEPVKAFAKGTAYIVEFWATWCGPCRVSIPHLNEIHEKFKDKGLVVIGQDCWERDEKLVAPFLKKMGEKMTYRVALDDKPSSDKGAMAETWMDAAGQNGIPSAFLIDKQGRVAWIGHPMTLKESVIEEVLAGSHDLKKAAADYSQRKEREAQTMTLSRQLNQAMRGKDWDKAEATVAEMEQGLPEDERSGLALTRVRILLGKGDLDGAGKLALKASDAAKDNAMVQNELAWQLAIQPGIKGSALDAAATIAARADTATGGKDAAILDTFARVTFLQGKTDKAIELQEKAVSVSEGPMKEQLQKALDSYKEGKLPAAE